MPFMEEVDVWFAREIAILPLRAGCDTLPIPMNLAQ